MKTYVYTIIWVLVLFGSQVIPRDSHAQSDFLLDISYKVSVIEKITGIINTHSYLKPFFYSGIIDSLQMITRDLESYLENKKQEEVEQSINEENKKNIQAGVLFTDNPEKTMVVVYKAGKKYSFEVSTRDENAIIEVIASRFNVSVEDAASRTSFNSIAGLLDN